MISRWQWKPNWVWLAARWAFSLDSPFSVESRSSTTFSGLLGFRHQLSILQVLHVPQGPKNWGGDGCQKEIRKSFDKKGIDRFHLGFLILKYLLNGFECFTSSVFLQNIQVYRRRWICLLNGWFNFPSGDGRDALKYEYFLLQLSDSPPRRHVFEQSIPTRSFFTRRLDYDVD